MSVKDSTIEKNNNTLQEQNNETEKNDNSSNDTTFKSFKTK